MRGAGMARRLKPLLAEHFAELPCGCTGCSFWESAEPLPIECGSACDLELVLARYGEISREWGDCGRVATEDGEVLGFIKYAPPRYFPQAMNMPAGPPNPDAVLLACIHIRDDARQHGLGSLLLRAALKDLVLRGERTVQAYAGASQVADRALEPVIGVEFLLRNGFNVAKPHPAYPLLELDLRSLATWADNLDIILQTLRFPRRAPKPVPSPMKSEENRR